MVNDNSIYYNINPTENDTGILKKKSFFLVSCIQASKLTSAASLEHNVCQIRILFRHIDCLV